VCTRGSNRTPARGPSTSPLGVTSESSGSAQHSKGFGSVQMTRRFIVLVLVILLVLATLWPLAFLVSPKAIDLGPGFNELYGAFTQLFGVDLGRWIFVGLWIVLDAFVLWRLCLLLIRGRVRDS
jgi:hypothetical protein